MLTAVDRSVSSYFCSFLRSIKHNDLVLLFSIDVSREDGFLVCLFFTEHVGENKSIF